MAGTLRAESGSGGWRALRKPGAIDLAHLPPERVAAFRAAQRHSRRVRFLRRAIPISCVLTLTLLTAWTFIDPFRKLPQGLTIGPVSLSGTKVTMEQPKLSGFKKDGKRYQVVADAMTQDIRKPNVFELHRIEAQLEAEAERFSSMKATSGQFDSTSELLLLREGVTVRTDTGHVILTDMADVEFKTGNIIARQPVKVESVSGTVEADSAEVKENGKYVVFEGRVRTVINRTGALDQDLKASPE
jgi:lipopolysaccharide export system protein LptC